MSNFGFTVVDVAELLDLTVRHRGAKSLDVDCPFCGKHGKLNLSLERNVYRCNYCQESGVDRALTHRIAGNSDTVGLGKNQLAKIIADAATVIYCHADRLTADAQAIGDQLQLFVLHNYRSFNLCDCVIVLATILLFAMLLSASCGGSGASDDTTIGDTSASDTTTAENANPEPNLPYTQYDGDDFTFFIRNPNGASYKEIYVWAEAENGEVVNDAIFKRNRQVEEKFDINIKMIAYESDDWDSAKELTPYVLSDDDSIDVISYMGSALMKNGLNGELVDFKELKYVNLTAEYWDANAVEQLAVGGKVYVMPNDISMGNLGSAYFTYFNQRLIDENNLENPYDIVEQNKWTIDKFAEMVKSAAREIDGDSTMTANDRFGLLFDEKGSNSAFAHALAACGIEFIDPVLQHHQKHRRYNRSCQRV